MWLIEGIELSRQSAKGILRQAHTLPSAGPVNFVHELFQKCAFPISQTSSGAYPCISMTVVCFCEFYNTCLFYGSLWGCSIFTAVMWHSLVQGITLLLFFYYFFLMCMCSQSSLENSMPWSFFLTNEGNSWLFLFIFQMSLHKFTWFITTETILGRFCCLLISISKLLNSFVLFLTFSILFLWKLQRQLRIISLNPEIPFFFVGCLDIFDYGDEMSAIYRLFFKKNKVWKYFIPKK